MNFKNTKELEDFCDILRIGYVKNYLNKYNEEEFGYDLSSLDDEDLLAIYVCLKIREKTKEKKNDTKGME